MSGLDPSPDQARDWLARELARPDYPRPSLLDRFVDWLGERLSAFAAAATGSGVGLLVAVAVAAVLAVVLVAALARVRRDGDRTTVEAGVLDLPDTADELRRRAQEALVVGRTEESLADAARALARRCVERGLLDDAPGRTTHEVYADVAARFAAHADDLRAAADRFDRVVYGRRPAVPAEAQSLLDLEDAVRRARPAAPNGSAGLAVPR